VQAAVLASMLASVLMAQGCRAPEAAPPPPKTVVQWHQLGRWSGRGNLQTQSFTSESGSLRVRWETTAGTGPFLLTIHSAISGRPLQVAVDRHGPGRDTAYINEDPRMFYAVVESASVDWSFTVEEAFSANTSAR
jgi:hypothetical protein